MKVAEICVSVKFDLGGTFADVASLHRALSQLGDVNDDHFEANLDARAFNISYVVTHPAVMSVALGTRQVDIGATRWKLTEEAIVYPQLGVLSIDLHFTEPRPDPSEEALLRFYDDVIDANHLDYLSYLRREEIDLPPSLRELLEQHERAPKDVSELRVSAYASQVRALCLDKAPREPVYPFQNLRMFYVLEDARQQLVDSLLNLRTALEATASHASGATTLAVNEESHYGAQSLVSQGTSLWSSGWSTVAVQSQAEQGTDLRSLRIAKEIYGLVHAQWFLCQIWIGLNPREPAYGGSFSAGETGKHLTRVEKAQVLLSRDLAEVANVDVMLRDPQRIAIASLFLRALRVERHRHAAEQRLALLAERYRQLSDARAARSNQRLQILFALAASAGVAGLVPPVVALDRVGYTLLTIGLALGLPLVFFLILLGYDRIITNRSDH